MPASVGREGRFGRMGSRPQRRGGLAIAVVYGWTTAGTGVICLVVGAGVFGLLWLILSLIERWLGRED